MTLTKKDEARVQELIRMELAKLPSERLLSDWEPENTLKVMIDGEEHEVALNPYYQYDEDGNKKTEFTWDEAMKIPKHPDGWRIPTRHEFAEIIEQLGQDDDGDINDKLTKATGWSGYFWSSTENASYTNCAWALGVSSSNAYVYNYDMSPSYQVVCLR